jgi:hypothetical protein
MSMTPDETVLGFFMAAGQNEKRIFVDHPEELDLTFSYCEPDYMGYSFIRLIHPVKFGPFMCMRMKQDGGLWPMRNVLIAESWAASLPCLSFGKNSIYSIFI